MDISVINTIIFNTIFKDAAAVASNGGYTIDGYHYNLFDTDTLNGGIGKIDPTISDKTEMMYTLDGSKNYVFVGIRGLNVIPSANVDISDISDKSINTDISDKSINTDISEVIILYSKSYIENIQKVISRYEKYVFFKDMYEDVSAGIVIYEELFIKIEQYFQANILVLNALSALLAFPKSTLPKIAAEKKSTLSKIAAEEKSNNRQIVDAINDIQIMMEAADEDLFLVSKFAEKFQIPKEVAKFNINLVKMGYSEYYTENKSFNSYIDHINNHILKLTVEEYVFLYNNTKAQHIADICYKEFLNIQKDIIQIGYVCEFILYFIGRYKQLTKQTCGSLFGTYFGSVFRESPIHIAKKSNLSISQIGPN